MQRVDQEAEKDSQYGKSRLQILKTAETLMATKGVYATSLREINQGANQKNASSVHYHFKDREGLIRAVLENHIISVEKRRSSLIQTIRESYPILDTDLTKQLSDDKREEILRLLVRSLICPLAEKIYTRSGRNYLRIIQEIVFSGKTEIGGAKTPQTFDDLINFTNGIRIASGYILKIVPEFPPLIVVMRGKVIARIVLSGLADLIPEIGPSQSIGDTVIDEDKNTFVFKKIGNIDLELVIANLTDVVLSIISYPVSDETLAVIRKSDLN